MSLLRRLCSVQKNINPITCPEEESLHDQVTLTFPMHSGPRVDRHPQTVREIPLNTKESITETPVTRSAMTHGCCTVSLQDEKGKSSSAFINRHMKTATCLTEFPSKDAQAVLSLQRMKEAVARSPAAGNLAAPQGHLRGGAQTRAERLRRWLARSLTCAISYSSL